MERVAQKTSYHCGPTTIQMLSSYLGLKIGQEEIVKAAGVGGRIREHGTTILELAKSWLISETTASFWSLLRGISPPSC